jgi:hypothetical protein
LKAVAKIEAEDSPARPEPFFFHIKSRTAANNYMNQQVNRTTICKLNVKTGGKGQQPVRFLYLHQGKFLPMTSCLTQKNTIRKISSSVGIITGATSKEQKALPSELESSIFYSLIPLRGWQYFLFGRSS